MTTLGGDREDPKVAILGGGGGVGASTAFNLLLRDEPYDCVLVDTRERTAESHAMDLEQVAAAGASGSVRVGGAEEVADAAMVVMAAAAPLTVNDSRLVYLRANADLLRSTAETLRAAGAGFHGALLIVTNPVDPLCTLAGRWTGLDRRRILGYSLNDSLRLRTAVAHATGLPASELDAWVIGEHGDAAVPLLDRVEHAGVPLSLEGKVRERARDFVSGWYARHVALDATRSSTWTTGLGVSRMVAELTGGGGGGGRWPASVLLDGEYGIEGVALTVPVSLGRGGVERIHELDLDPAERDALVRAAVLVRDASDSVADPR